MRSSAGDTRDACATLTAREIADQLGVEMKDGVRSGDSPNASDCTWESVDPMKGAAVIVTVEPYDEYSFQVWHGMATPEHPEVPLSGIGDEAFVVGGAILGGITVLRMGDIQVQMQVIGTMLDQAIVAAARAPLAALVVSRISNAQ